VESAKKPKLKIGLVLDGGLEKPDGVQQYILAIGKWMIDQGHEVRYIVAGKIAPGIDNAISLSRDMRIVSNGNRLTIPLPSSWKKLRNYIDEENFDVLHVQTPYSPMMGERLIFAASDSTAIIGTFHIVPFNKLLSIGDWLLGHYCYYSLKKFDHMLSVSTAAQKVAKKDFRIYSEVLPNVVDYKRFNKAKPFTKYKNGKINILFFGRLVERKGCIILLRTIKYLRDNELDLPDFSVIVCGTGPQLSQLEDYVKKNGLSEIVEFVGFISEADKPRYYASADISVFPSTGGESFGIVLLEAMSSGQAAVLGGNNVGYSSVLSPRPNLIFDTSNDLDLAAKLSVFLKDKEARLKCADWAKNYAKGFDVNVIGKKLEKLYIKTVCEKQPHRG
jgi:phosphatidylinositol alpha-mannosyltransferase